MNDDVVKLFPYFFPVLFIGMWLAISTLLGFFRDGSVSRDITFLAMSPHCSLCVADQAPWVWGSL
jgi:hypothetical protein